MSTHEPAPAPPSLSFSDLPAHPALARALTARGYALPTPVQASVLAAELDGRDLLVSSQTGSGKTVAFGLAMARELLGESEKFPRASSPLALVIAPTRELALQVQRELGWLYGDAGVRTASCVGGMEMRRELSALQAGAHLVVGTPGRLVDHLERGSLQLANLKALVLDEADEMLDMGFRDELERILKDAPTTRRTLLFSATLPRGIEELANRYQREAARVQAGPPAGAHRDISYRAHLIAFREREHAVVNVLREAEAPAAIVFVSTRDSVNHLHASLVERGFAAVALSGELTQSERTRALKALRDGRARVLVATDVAARGLDLPDVGLVIHADLPHDAQVLQHRSGRTGRAGKRGTAVLLVPSGLRRAADRLIHVARIKPVWSPVPSLETIHKLDEERLVADTAALADDVGDEDRSVASRLLQERSAEEVAALLASVLRARRPAAEELPLSAGMGQERPRPAAPRIAPTRAERPDSGWSERPERIERTERPERTERTEPAARTPRPARGDGSGTWFALNVGRAHNADPRWLVPLLCRRGKITKREIGSIRILNHETRVEIAPQAAEQFGHAVRVPDRQDNNIRIVPSQAPESRGYGSREEPLPDDRPAPRNRPPRRPFEGSGGDRPPRRPAPRRPQD